MDAFDEKVFEEDFIANRNVTAESYPCVLDLTLLFFSVFLLVTFTPGIQNSQLTFRKATHEESQE